MSSTLSVSDKHEDSSNAQMYHISLLSAKYLKRSRNEIAFVKQERYDSSAVSKSVKPKGRSLKLCDDKSLRIFFLSASAVATTSISDRLFFLLALFFFFLFFLMNNSYERTKIDAETMQLNHQNKIIGIFIYYIF